VRRGLYLVLAALLAGAVGCDSDDAPDRAGRTPSPSPEERLNEKLSGSVRIATAPATQPFATGLGADYSTETPVDVKVRKMGSRAAFARLCRGRVAMAAVDRRIDPEMRRVCRRHGIEPLRIDIGWLVVGVAASSELDLDCISLPELRRIWRPGSTVDRYELYGTAAFELFTREVVGRADAIRSDWTPAEDAAATEAGLARGDRALAFVNREVLHPLDSGVEWVAVDAGDGCVRPSVSAVRAGRYPLADPLYLYVSRSALDELRVRSLARFAVVEYGQLIPTVRTIVPADPRAVERSARELPPAPIPEG
jgi:phosphate transport system substrate-binding protein